MPICTRHIPQTNARLSITSRKKNYMKETSSFLFDFMVVVVVSSYFGHEGLVRCFSLWWRTYALQFQQPNGSYRRCYCHHYPHHILHPLRCVPYNTAWNKERGIDLWKIVGNSFFQLCSLVSEIHNFLHSHLKSLRRSHHLR